MAAKTRYLEYFIFLTDRVAVTALQAQYPDGLRVAPATAAVTYSAPIATRWTAFYAPSTRSAFFWATSSSNLPQTEATFVRKTGGWFGIPSLFGSLTTHIWVGKFMYQAGVPEINGVVTEIVAMAQRRWATGFEVPIEGDTDSGGTASRSCCRDASRHPDGLGWAYRGDTGDIVNTLARWKPGNTSRNHWDRFYIRVRKAPTTAARFYLCNGGSGNDGIRLELTTGLAIALYNVSSGAAVLISSTSLSLTLNIWARIDIVASYATGAGGAGAMFKLYINGALAATLLGIPATGLGSQGAWQSSALGSVTATTLEADFDDWVGSELPVEDSQGRYVGKDWLNGSKVQRLMATGFGTGHDAVNWTNQSYSNLNPFPEAGTASTGMVSTTAAAAIVVNTDAKLKVDTLPGAMGIAYLQAIVYHNGATSGAHSLGFKIAAGTLDLLVLPATVGLAYGYHYYKPSGLVNPLTPIDVLTLHYLKDNDATSDTVYALTGVAEIIGVFGLEDVYPGVTAPTSLPRRALGAHNNPYPESPYARLTTAPAAPYAIHSGTYAGNSLGQDLYFRLPVHWLFIRRIDTATYEPSLTLAPDVASSEALDQKAAPDRPVQLLIDPTFGVGTNAEDAQEQRTIARVTGVGVDVNVTGGTYQYVAVSDPVGRFLLTGGFGHGAVNAVRSDALPNTTFTPETGFFNNRAVNGSATFYSWFKGLGHAANAASPMNAAETAEFLSWAAGLLTPLDGSTILTYDSYGFALWRRDDGSADALAKAKCVQLGTYTGDGTASRTVSFGPIGLRPLFLYVQPANATGYFRDPGNLGTASKNISGLNNTTTAITGGGIDSFSVGSVLNAAGIVYSWFLLPGSATAGNGGWSIDGEFIPVEPDTPFDGPFPPGDASDPPPSTTPVDPDPDPGPDDDDDCTDGTVCVAATTSIVNLALLEIGVQKILTNYCTQTTREAEIAQEVYESCVRHTLVAYPWPFATKYATLVLIATQPTHADWTYAYRMPSDCVFARRLVVSRGRAADPTPPPMGFSSDASGGIIFSNEATPVLEYTCRPACVAYNGDDLFLEALKWRLAAALAPPLTRIAGEADRCIKMFEIIVQKAEATKKPGTPGLRPAADVGDPDTTAAAIAANIQVVNRALVRIGAKTIANLTTEQSREAIAAKLVFEDELRATLRDYPWAFATRYLSTPTLVGGTATVPVNPDWQYSYRAPTDLVTIRRLVIEGAGRSYQFTPNTWRMASDATGGLFFTAEVEPLVEYTARINNLLVYADPIFRDALAWRLAAVLAPSVAQVDPEYPEQHGRGPDTPQEPSQRHSRREREKRVRHGVAMQAWRMYEHALLQAKVADANEQQQEKHGEAEWIDGRQ